MFAAAVVVIINVVVVAVVIINVVVVVVVAVVIVAVVVVAVVGRFGFGPQLILIKIFGRNFAPSLAQKWIKCFH